jgi:hypothetical protein
MESRTFTTEDIAYLTGYSKEGVRGILHDKGFKPEIRPTKISRQAVWSYEAYRCVAEWGKEHLEAREKKAAEKKTEVEQSLEQLKAEHPLIQDERCFKLSWWPDTVPDCYKEFEE